MRQLLLVIALAASSAAFADTPQLVAAARQQTRSPVTYDGSYTRIGYPMGDVPRGRGVCSDVVIRAYRAIGIDLQVLVHEDMRENLSIIAACPTCRSFSSGWTRRWGMQALRRLISRA